MGLDHLITRNKKETMNSLHIISIADTNGKNHKSASLMSRIEEEATEECDNCGEMMVDCTCMEEDFEQPEEFCLDSMVSRCTL